ncbi:MAG: tRNA 2-thiouridine(34) synthase MnmA [Thomasclavelia sp.]|nr:tRNA 2-thiouridine(34) synthase MnmA [Thomasclavelia sp.]
MKRVLLGMSGGVDSSVSAILLLKQGYEVVGVTFKMFDESNASIDAKRVADKLGIKHFEYDCTNTFQKYVKDYFANSYKNLETPNPCIECNKYLKFGLMYQLAKENNCEYIATGHYASTVDNKTYGHKVIARIPSKKDQTYVLYKIKKEVLDYIVFPLAPYESKDEIRAIAKENNLDIASKPDSEDICFIPDGDYKKYLLNNTDIKNKEGDIVLKDGSVLGKHQGLFRYTIGQRKGLGISYPHPLFVLDFNPKKNQLIVGPKEDLYKKEIVVTNVNYHFNEDFQDGLKVKVKIRYAAPLVDAYLYHSNQDVKVVFDEAQASPTPGQGAVFYLDNYLMGGGKISRIQN